MTTSLKRTARAAVLSLMIATTAALSVPCAAQTANRNVKIETGKTTTLNAGKKAEWKISKKDGKTVRLSVKKGKKKASVKGLKPGKAVVRAKIGKKSIVWKITVKKKASSENASKTNTGTQVSPEDPAFWDDGLETASETGNFDGVLALKIFMAVNNYRTDRGLSPLKADSSLVCAAKIRAREAAELFSHSRPDGSQYFTAGDTVKGENLSFGNWTPEDVVEDWDTSPTHKANLMREFKTGGVSVFLKNEGDGNQTPYVAFEFGW